MKGEGTERQMVGQSAEKWLLRPSNKNSKEAASKWSQILTQSNITPSLSTN